MKSCGVVLSVLCLLYFIAAVYSQMVPNITFNGSILANHSYLNINLIAGSHDDTDFGVKCVTDLVTCCSSTYGPYRGDWLFPNGERLPFRYDLIEGPFEVRGDMDVTLFYPNNNVPREGIYECLIETNAVHNNGNRENIYIGLYSRGGKFLTCTIF